MKWHFPFLVGKGPTTTEFLRGDHPREVKDGKKASKLTPD